MFKKRKIVFPLVKSTTKFITRCKGLLSLSTPLTVFQWTFHNSGHLDFTVSSLNCGISPLVENPEERPCCFHLLRCLISLKGSGMGWGGEPGGVRESRCGRLLPQVCLVHTPGPPPPHPRPFQQKPGRLGQATSNSGYRIYSVSSLSHSLSTIKRDFHERQECR